VGIDLDGATVFSDANFGAGNKVQENIFSGVVGAYGFSAVSLLSTLSSYTLNATKNYWGSLSGPTHASNPEGVGNTVSNNVDYDPWFTNAVFTALSDGVVADAELTSTTSGQAELPEGETDLALTDDTVLDLLSGMSTASGTDITVGGETLDLGSFTSGTLAAVDLTIAKIIGDVSVIIEKAVKLVSGTLGQPIVLTNNSANAPSVTVSIPDDTTVMAPSGWTGTMQPPKTGSSLGTAPGGFDVGGTVVDVGDPLVTLLFDKPVKVTLIGVTGSVAYKPAGSSTWNQITTTCNSASDASNISFPEECYATSGNDTIIWTYHFTSFANITSTPLTNGAVLINHLPGSGEGGSSAPSITSSARSIGSNGGSLTTTLSSGSSASVQVSEGTFDSTTIVEISETTSSQKASAPLVETSGSFVGNNIYSIQASSNGANITQFDSPITLEFSYIELQIKGSTTKNLRIAYFDDEQDEWIPLPSIIDSYKGTITALVDHFTLFALISFINPETTGTIYTGEGQVAGAAVGAYPNGALLKARNSPEVWHITGDQKHLIRSVAIFESRFNWNDIIELPSSRQLDLYAQGSDIKFAAGTLVKEQKNNSVYRVSMNHGIQPILSEEIFLARGYNFENVAEVEVHALSSYAQELYIKNSEQLYNGDLIKLANDSAVYLIETDRVRLIPSPSIFRENAFKSYAIAEVSDKQFAEFAKGNDILYPDGTLIKGNNNTVYVISNSRKRPIVKSADFEALLYDWNKIVYVPDTLLASIANAPALQVIQNKVRATFE